MATPERDARRWFPERADWWLVAVASAAAVALLAWRTDLGIPNALPRGAIVSVEGGTSGYPFVTASAQAEHHTILSNTGGAIWQGLPVALVLCGAALWAVLRLRPWRETDPLRQMAWAVLAVMGLHSVLEYSLWYGPFQMAAGICLGLLVVVPQSHSRRPLAALGLTVPLTVGVGLAALDYHRARQIYLSSEERDASYADQTLEKAREAWIFRDQVRFAELTTTPLERANAEWTLTSATSLLRFSPEPRVIEKAVESAVMLGRDDEALPLLIRFRTAFPKEHDDWAAALRKPPVTPEEPD